MLASSGINERLTWQARWQAPRRRRSIWTSSVGFHVDSFRGLGRPWRMRVEVSVVTHLS